MPNSLDPIPAHLQPFIADIVLWARSLLEKGEKVPTLFFIGNTRTGSVVQMPVDNASNESRLASAHAARHVAQIEKADFVLNVSEAWALSAKDTPRYEEIYERYGSLGAYPHRLDVVSFQLEAPEGVFGAASSIKPKPPSKKRRTFADPKFVKADAAQGRLANILPRQDSQPLQ